MDPNRDGDLNAGSRGYAFTGKVMLASTVILFAAVLLLLSLHFYLRSRYTRRHSHSRHPRRRLVFASEATRGALPASSAAHRGLDPAVLKALPLLVFDAKAGGQEAEEDAAAECAVCLNEFEDGEKMRVLPQCGHRFHIECIGMWFHSHDTCPLCRSAVDAPPPAANQVLVPLPAPPEPGRPSPADLCAECWGEGGIGPSASSSAQREIRIEVPDRGSEGEVGLALKSTGNRMLRLTRLLSWDSRACRGGGTAAEPDLERGEGAAIGRPPPPPPSSLHR